MIPAWLMMSRLVGLDDEPGDDRASGSPSGTVVAEAVVATAPTESSPAAVESTARRAPVRKVVRA